jgi:hypothetical protein
MHIKYTAWFVNTNELMFYRGMITVLRSIKNTELQADGRTRNFLMLDVVVGLLGFNRLSVLLKHCLLHLLKYKSKITVMGRMPARNRVYSTNLLRALT